MEQFNTREVMKTALYEKHLFAHAKMVDFAGWQMPLQYEGILKEHLAVRHDVGLFDVSHMGVIDVSGKQAEIFLDSLSTNAIKGRKKHRAIYTVWPNKDGGSVDDLIVYPLDENHFFVVVNASNRTKSLNHLKEHARNFDVNIKDRYQDMGILSLQGPNSLKLISLFFLEAKHLKKMDFVEVLYDGQKIIISHTGYTGELGFEIYAPQQLILKFFDQFLNEGKKFGLKLAGLGCRDSLRLEMGYCLYGHELSEKIAANESVSSWTIRAEGREFLGKTALVNLERSHKKRNQYGLLLEGRAIAREGFSVFKEGTLIGKITSGNYSPILEKPIAIFLSDILLSEGDSVEVLIRDKAIFAQIKNLPFYQKNSIN